MSLFNPRDEQLLHTREWSDSDRCAFIQNLDLAELEVTTFEASFIDSALNRIIRAEGDEVTFSPAQRRVIEEMYRKYDEHI